MSDGADLASDLEAMEEVAEVMAKRTELGQRFDLVAMVGEFRKALLEELDYRQEARNLERLGENLNKSLDLLAGNRIRFKVDAFDEVYMMEGLQKIANRITLGLVMAALIVGAALLMQVETSFTLLGYPGLAMILFSAAVAGVSPWP